MLLSRTMLTLSSRWLITENLQAVPVAKVQADPRLVMNWNGKKIVDISREFLNSNGADKHIDITPEAPALKEKEISGSFAEKLLGTRIGFKHLLEARTFRAFRFNDRRGHGTHAVRRQESADSHSGDGAENIRREEAY